MRTRNILIVLLSSFLVLGAFLLKGLFNQNEGAKEKSDPVQPHTLLLRDTTFSRGTRISVRLVPARVETVRFEVDGILQMGDIDLKKGTSFRFNSTICKLDIRQVYIHLAEQKKQLKKTLQGMLPSVENQFADQYSKWLAFDEGLDVSRRLPELPGAATKEEALFFRKGTFVSEYKEAQRLEREIERHFWISDFSGTVDEVYVKPGKKVKAGKVIARLIVGNTFYAQVDFPSAQFSGGVPETMNFTSEEGIVVGSGKLKQVKNISTDPVTAVYTFVPEKGFVNGTPLFCSSGRSERVFRIPAVAVNDNAVRILKGETTQLRDVQTVHQEGKWVYVSGLSNGELLVLP